MRKHLNIFDLWSRFTEIKQTQCQQRGQMCVTAVNLILFDSRAFRELFCRPTWNALRVYNSDLIVGYGGEISYTQNRVVYKNERTHFVLQEPVKRNPTHARFHPALSFMLLCCNHLAITLSVSPSPLLDTKAGRKHGRPENREWLLDWAGQPKEAVSGFPLTTAGMWSRELRGPTMGHVWWWMSRVDFLYTHSS